MGYPRRLLKKNIPPSTTGTSSGTSFDFTHGYKPTKEDIQQKQALDKTQKQSEQPQRTLDLSGLKNIHPADPDHRIAIHEQVKKLFPNIDKHTPTKGEYSPYSIYAPANSWLADNITEPVANLLHKSAPFTFAASGLDATTNFLKEGEKEHPLPNTFTGNLVKGLSQSAPQAAAALLTGGGSLEGQAAELTGKYLTNPEILQNGLQQLYNPITKSMVAIGALKGAGNAAKKGENVLEGAASGGFESFEQAALLGGSMKSGEMLGKGLYDFGKKAGVFDEGGKLTEQALKSLIGTPTSFAASSAASDIAHGRPIDWKNALAQGASAIPFEVPHLLNTRVANFADAKPEDIARVSKMKETAPELQVQALAKGVEAQNNPDDANSLHLQQLSLQHDADIKANIDAIENDKNGYLSAVEQSNMPDEAKQELAQKVQMADPVEQQKQELGKQIGDIDEQLKSLQKSEDPVKQAENEVKQEQLKAKREELNNNLKQLIVKQNETKNEGQSGQPAKSSEIESSGQTEGQQERPVQGGRENDEVLLNKTGEAAAEPVLNYPKPKKPLDEMTSDEIREHSKEVRNFYKSLDKQLFGEEGAKEYQRAQSVSNSSFSSSDARKEADVIIDRYHNKLTPKQAKAFFGEDESYDDPDDLMDLAQKVGFIEQSENVDELAGSIKNPLLDFSSGKNKQDANVLLKAAARKARKLGLDPKEMLGRALERISKDLPDKEDQELLVNGVLRSIAKTSEDNQKQLPDAVNQEQEKESGGAEHQDGDEGRKTAETSSSDSPERTAEGEGKEVKKTILTKRAYEGEVQPEVKKHLEEKGLTRKSFSPEERSKQATDLIGKFGDDAALMAVKQGDVDGALASSILAQLHIRNSDAIEALPEDSDEREELAKKDADIIHTMEQKGYFAGEYIGQLAHEYQNRDMNFASIKRQVEKLQNKPLSKEQEKRVKELSDENEKLKTQLSESEAKLIEETDKAFQAGKEEAKNETKAQKAKRIADKIRQGKLSRPGVFSAATPASVVWDGAVEVVAKSVEAGGKLADAIDEGLEHIRKSDWYKGLSKSKQSEAESEFTKAHHDTAGSTDLADLQQRFTNKRDNKFTPNEAKSIWGYMKENYINNGTSYRDAISKTAQDLGLSWRQVSEAIVTPKTKRMSDEMWKRQAEYSRYRSAIRSWVDNQSKSPIVRLWRDATGVLRGITVFGHGAIFSGTHAGMTFFSPPTIRKSINAFLNGWKFAYGKEANYARAMEELKHEPNYLIAQRAGLKNDPDRLDVEEYQRSQKYLDKIGLGKVARSGERGFNAIKVLRQNLFDYHFNKLSAAERDDPMVAKSIADIVNLATGATPTKLPEWYKNITFAGGMEVARWQKLLQSPAKAAMIATKVLTKPEEATPAEKVFLKVWSTRAGIQLGTISTALIANAALQKKLNPNNPVNLTNPDKPDFGKFKFGDYEVDPTSGMRSTAQFIYKLGKLPLEKQKELRGEDRIKVLGKDAAQYAKGKLSPAFSDLAEIYSGRDFAGNVVPWSGEKPAKYAHKLGYGEYIWSKMPLPVAEAAETTYKSAIDSGGDPATVKNLIKGIISGALSGGTGFRVGQSDTKKKGLAKYVEIDKN